HRFLVFRTTKVTKSRRSRTIQRFVTFVFFVIFVVKPLWLPAPAGPPYTPKITIFALAADTGNTPDRVPATNATACRPSIMYVMTPPPAAPGSSARQRTLPLAASNAYACLSMSPANTTPPLVGVTPDSTGAPARKRHFTCPVSASVAISHTAQFASRLPNCAARSVPVHVSPGFLASCDGSSVMVTHQSTVP